MTPENKRIVPLDEVKSREMKPGELMCAFYDKIEGDVGFAVRSCLDESLVPCLFVKDILKVSSNILQITKDDWASLIEELDVTIDKHYVGPSVSTSLSGDKEFETLTEHGFCFLISRLTDAVVSNPGKNLSKTSMVEFKRFVNWVLNNYLAAIKKTGMYYKGGFSKTVGDMFAFLDLMHEHISENFKKQELRLEEERSEISQRIDSANDNIIRLKDEVSVLKENSDTIKNQTTALGNKVFDQLMPLQGDQVYNKPVEKEEEQKPVEPVHPWTEEEYLLFRMYFAQAVHLINQPKGNWMSTIWTHVKLAYGYCPRDIKMSGTAFKNFCKAHDQDPEKYPARMSDLNNIMKTTLFDIVRDVDPIESIELWNSGKAAYRKVSKSLTKLERSLKRTNAKPETQEILQDKFMEAYTEYEDIVVSNRVFDFPDVARNVKGEALMESYMENAGKKFFSFSFTGVGGPACSEEDLL